MNKTSIHSHRAKRAWYEELGSNVFVLNDSDLEGLLAHCPTIPGTLERLKEICFPSKVSRQDAVELVQLMEAAIGRMETLKEAATRCSDQLSLAQRLATTGAGLFVTQDVLTELPPSILGLGGSRERVSDKDFERRTFFWLDPSKLSELEDEVRQFLALGELKPLPSDESQVAQTSITEELLLLFTSFGLGMCSTTPSVLLADLPEIWSSFIRRCKGLHAVCSYISELAASSVLDGLTSAHGPLTQYLKEESGKGDGDITLQSMFSTKPGVKDLRAAIEETHRLPLLSEQALKNVLRAPDRRLNG